MNAPISLTPDEEKLLYYVEVMGMSAKRAGELTHVEPATLMQRPEAQLMREQLREANRKKTEITKEDIIEGYKHAIQQADLIAEPMTQIAGWREIARMLGYDKPQEVIVWHGDQRGIRRQIAQKSDEELVKLLGADDVIDGEFYDAKPQS